MLRRWFLIALVATLPLFTSGCGIWEPADEVPDAGEEELKGPGLFTGKEGGLVIYQR
jgi:hypothetical protein